MSQSTQPTLKMNTDHPLYPAYVAFDKENPHVYHMLVKIAGQVYAKGKSAYGMKAVFERLRWISAFETVGDPYKLNNNFTAFYSRRLMLEHPPFQGFFQLRRQRGEA